MDLSELNAKRCEPLIDQIAKAKLGAPAPVSPTGDKYRCTTKVRQQQKRLQANETQLMIAEYRAGSTVYQLADKFGCHRTTVSGLLRSAGVNMRLTSLTEAEIHRAVELYASGLSLVKIGKLIGANAETIRQRLRHQGVKMRSPHGTPAQP